MKCPIALSKSFCDQNVNLLPEQGDDLITNCTCPDWSNPCKHIAGTYYKVASMLDRDPFLLFQLRGMDKAHLHQALAKSPLGKALLDQWDNQTKNKAVLAAHHYTQPVMQTQAVDWQNFWQAPQLPTTNLSPKANKSCAALIKKGGDYPSFWHRDNSFIEAMEALYETVLKKNKQLINTSL